MAGEGGCKTQESGESSFPYWDVEAAILGKRRHGDRIRANLGETWKHAHLVSFLLRVLQCSHTGWKCTELQGSGFKPRDVKRSLGQKLNIIIHSFGHVVL